MKTQTSLAAAVFGLIVGSAVFLKWNYEQSRSFAEVEGVVTITQHGGVKSEPSGMLRPPDAVLDGEVARQTERLRDLCDLGLTATEIVVGRETTAAPSSSTTGRSVRRVEGVLAALDADPVYTVDWRAGVIRTKRSLMSLRFRPDPLSIEVVSLPQEDQEGPAMLMRLPDRESDIGPRYFQSRTVGIGTWYPPPFSDYAVILAGNGTSPGWTEERLRVDVLNGGATLHGASGDSRNINAFSKP